MPNPVKLQKVTALKERIEDAEALLLAEYRGLSVQDATELRRSLSGQARFSIVKNTLMQRAAADAGLDELRALLEGPTAVAFVDGDVVATAKKVVDAAKRFPALVLKGGYMEGRVLSATEAQALATLESREVMLSKIAGMLKAEMSRAASLFQTIQGRFASVLDAYRSKLPAEADQVAADDATTDEQASEGAIEDQSAPQDTAAVDQPRTDETPGEDAEQPQDSNETEEDR